MLWAEASFQFTHGWTRQGRPDYLRGNETTDVGRIILGPQMVVPYRPRPVACDKCHMIGHKQDICPSVHIKCNLWGRTQEKGLPCQDDTPQCANCGGPHLGTGCNCPGRIKVSKDIREKAKRCKARQAETTKPTKAFHPRGNKPTPGPSGRQRKQAEMQVRKPRVVKNGQPKPTELVTSQEKLTMQKALCIYCHSPIGKHTDTIGKGDARFPKSRKGLHF